MKSAFDVIVIGGGVAGCSAAITLAQQGARVALIEAKAYPQYKVCGEVLSSGCLPLLDELDVLNRVQTFSPPIIRTARITAPDGAAWEAPLPGPALGFSRYALDQLLVEQAQALGVDVQTRATVTGIDGSLEQGFAVQTRSGRVQQSYRAYVVIGAHGKRSVLDRVMGRRFFRQPQPFVGLKAHFCGPTIPGRVELHSFEGGYCGLSEIEGNRVNACLLVRQQIFQRHCEAGVEGFIEWMRRQNPALDTWFTGAEMICLEWLSISQIPFVSKTVIERDVLMAGDAAGLIAPLAGDGIEMALRSGCAAGLMSMQFLNNRWSAAELRRQYTHAWRQVFSGRLRLGRLLQAVMLRPALLSPGLRVVNCVPSLGQYFIRQTRDEPLAVRLGELM